MTDAFSIRRTRPGRVLLRAALLVGLALLVWPQPVGGARPDVPPNLLDRPMRDLAILDPPEAGTPPMLLVLDATGRSPSVARVVVMRRDDAWASVATKDIDLEADGLDARWFVDLGEGRFALVASSPQTAPGSGRAVVVGLVVDQQQGAARIEEQNRQTFDRAIEDAGAADVDGFGAAELVLGLRPHVDSESCGTSTLVVVDGSIAAVRRSIDIPGPRGAGVLGRFDGVPGTDLLVYASAGCPPGGHFASNLLDIRLADGSQSRVIEGVMPFYPTAIPPPLLLDLDGSPPDEVIALGRDGLSVFDPTDTENVMLVAGLGSVPLVVGQTGQPLLPGTRVAIFDAAGEGALVTARVRRDKAAGLLMEGRSELAGGTLDPMRWSILTSAIQSAATHQATGNAWIGDAVDTACPYVVLPGAVVPCGTDELRSGAAWLATRPVAAMTIGGQRLILVAAGLDWRPETLLPATPTPAATGTAGWWRHGPSAPFALAEIQSDDVSRFHSFPKPAATIETTTSADGITEVVGHAGTRFFATIAPLAEGHQRGLPSTDALLALTTRPLPGGRRAVVRAAVPEGGDSGRAESAASLDPGDLQLPDDQPIGGWAMRVVPVNDLGEWGQSVSGMVTHDDIAPAVVVEEPFTSPIWPLSTVIGGRSEPGTTIHIDGMGQVAVDARGGFTINAQLAPWPQAFRVTAIDLAGNETVGTFSIVGGVDYRRFPWPGIVAVGLLALVTARGLFGGERGRAAGIGATRSPPALVDDDFSLPVIEELPPGTGLAPR